MFDNEWVVSTSQAARVSVVESLRERSVFPASERSTKGRVPEVACPMTVPIRDGQGAESLHTAGEEIDETVVGRVSARQLFRPG